MFHRYGKATLLKTGRFYQVMCSVPVGVGLGGGVLLDCLAKDEFQKNQDDWEAHLANHKRILACFNACRWHSDVVVVVVVVVVVDDNYEEDDNDDGCSILWLAWQAEFWGGVDTSIRKGRCPQGTRPPATRALVWSWERGTAGNILKPFKGVLVKEIIFRWCFSFVPIWFSKDLLLRQWALGEAPSSAKSWSCQFMSHILPTKLDWFSPSQSRFSCNRESMCGILKWL